MNLFRKFRPNPQVSENLLKISIARVQAATAWITHLARVVVNDESTGSASVKVSSSKGKLHRPEATVVYRLDQRGTPMAMSMLAELVEQWSKEKTTGTIQVKFPCADGDFGHAELALTQFLGQP